MPMRMDPLADAEEGVVGAVRRLAFAVGHGPPDEGALLGFVFLACCLQATAPRHALR
jgi:hypothetical protein